MQSSLPRKYLVVYLRIVLLYLVMGSCELWLKKIAEYLGILVTVSEANYDFKRSFFSNGHS